MIRFPIATALALTLLPLCATAQVFRCQKDGTTVFSDKPCAEDAQTYAPTQPLVVVPSDTRAADMAKQYDQRNAKDAQSRDKANEVWSKDHQAQKKQEEAFRDARMKRKAAVGMSQQQVRDLLGEPQITSRNENLGVVREGWTYKNRDGSRTIVYFKDGVVSKITSRRGHK
jgi:hypothetical protein